MISCITFSTNRIEKLNECIAGFLAQDFHGDRELIILTRMPIKCDHPNVRVVATFRQMLVADARNKAIAEATGDIIVFLPEDDYALPNHLSLIASSILDQDWIWIDKEIVFERGKMARIQQGSTSLFVFKKSAWMRAGKFSHGINGACERNFIGKMTKKCSGEKIAIPPEQISFVRIGSEVEKRINRNESVPVVPKARYDYAGLAADFISGRPTKCLAVVELGRNGDIINILPFLKHINDTYEKPSLVISEEFAPLLEGVSYVKPYPLKVKNEELGSALATARREFSIVINAQIWGKGWTQERKCESYNVESWRNCGWLHKFGDASIVPVFDQRDSQREAELLKTVHDTGKPWLLVNLSSAISSPCPLCARLMDSITQKWGDTHQIIDLSKIKAHRLYDMLALMERAMVLISIDTSFLHLAAACETPVVALVNPRPSSWASSAIRANCAARMTYDEAIENPELVNDGIGYALTANFQSRIVLGRASGKLSPSVSPKIFHVVERHDESDAKTIERKTIAWKSWDVLYERGEIIPAHYWNYTRTADKEIGDKRDLPYLKDVIKFGMDQANDEDIIMWGNDDNSLHPKLAEYLKFHISVYGVCTSFRSEIRGKMPSYELRPDQFDRGTIPHMGRDLFAAKKSWFKENWDKIPDFILGASDFDLCLAALVRNHYGIKTTNANITELMFPAEIQRGYIHHIFHHNRWSKSDNVNSAPSQIHNRKLFREWAQINAPALRFNQENTLGT